MPATKPMLKLIWNEAYWVDRADNARAFAGKLRNPECRVIVLEMAVSHDRLAKLTSDFRSSSERLRDSGRDVIVSIGTKADDAID